MLAVPGQHVAVLAAVTYFALRAFAVPAATRALTTVALIWAGVVASFVLAAGLLGRQISPV